MGGRCLCNNDVLEGEIASRVWLNRYYSFVKGAGTHGAGVA